MGEHIVRYIVGQDGVNVMISPDRVIYKHNVTFMLIESMSGDFVSLPVYMLLLNEDLLRSLTTKESRLDEELKIESQHGPRKFRVWFVQGESVKVRIEEFMGDDWDIVHSYRPL